MRQTPRDTSEKGGFAGTPRDTRDQTLLYFTRDTTYKETQDTKGHKTQRDTRHQRTQDTKGHKGPRHAKGHSEKGGFATTPKGTQETQRDTKGPNDNKGHKGLRDPNGDPGNIISRQIKASLSPPLNVRISNLICTHPAKYSIF